MVKQIAIGYSIVSLLVRLSNTRVREQLPTRLQLIDVFTVFIFPQLFHVILRTFCEHRANTVRTPTLILCHFARFHIFDANIVNHWIPSKYIKNKNFIKSYKTIFQQTHNLEVPGSSPGWSTLKIKELQQCNSFLFRHEEKSDEIQTKRCWIFIGYIIAMEDIKFYQWFFI